MHKTDVGAVRLGLDGPDQVISAAKEMARRCAREEGILVGPLVTTAGFALLVLITFRSWFSIRLDA